MASSRISARFLQTAVAPVRRTTGTAPIRRHFASAAEGSSGGPPVSASSKPSTDNLFNRERRAQKEHAASTSDLWRKLSIYVGGPCLILAAANAWVLWNEHWEHWAHMPPLEERVEYPYQNVRTKNFFWGDGDKTLFWNDKVNYHKKD